MQHTLILVPGLAGDRAMWQAQLEGLAAFAPVVTDVHTRHATIGEMAAALLREHAGPLVVCGASMGGMVAMEAARQAPERIAGMALLGTSARPETPDMRLLREAAIKLYAAGRIAEVIEPNVKFAFHPANGDRLAAPYMDFIYRAGADQLVRQNRAVIERPDARKHLPSVRCPVLVLCGDADQLTPPECAREIAALVPNARLAWVPECGHMLTMERPELVNRELREWLATLQA